MSKAKELLSMTEIDSSDPNAWGIRWAEFGKGDRTVTKEKFFKTEKERDTFADKVEKKDNFSEFLAWSDPRK